MKKQLLSLNYININLLIKGNVYPCDSLITSIRNIETIQ